MSFPVLIVVDERLPCSDKPFLNDSYHSVWAKCTGAVLLGVVWQMLLTSKWVLKYMHIYASYPNINKNEFKQQGCTIWPTSASIVNIRYPKVKLDDIVPFTRLFCQSVSARQYHCEHSHVRKELHAQCQQTVITIRQGSWCTGLCFSELAGLQAMQDSL